MKDIYERADDEIYHIENDESMTEEEKRQAIREILAEVRDYEREYGRNNDYTY